MTSINQGEFDADEYVERLASTVEGGGIKGGPKAFDPKKLSQVFEKTIRDLRALDEQMQGRINKLEELCITEQEEHRRKAREMEKTYKVFLHWPSTGLVVYYLWRWAGTFGALSRHFKANPPKPFEVF